MQFKFSVVYRVKLGQREDLFNRLQRARGWYTELDLWISRVQRALTSP
jgi:hypothetical protein